MRIRTKEKGNATLYFWKEMACNRKENMLERTCEIWFDDLKLETAKKHHKPQDETKM